MNRKILCIPGLLILAGLLCPFQLSAQNLIQNGSFSEPLKESTPFSIDFSNKAGSWVSVSGNWGWKPVLSDGKTRMHIMGLQYSIKGNAAKGLVQCIADMRKTNDRCTLQFSYFLKNATVGSQEGNYIKVSVFGFNGSKPPTAVNLHAPLANVTSLKLLGSRDLSEMGSKDLWTTASLDVDLGAGYDYIFVEFSGSGKNNEAGIGDVEFYSKSSPVTKSSPPAKPVVAKPAPAVAPKPAPVVAPVVAPKPEPAPVKVVAAPVPRPVPEPIRPPVSNLILSGDFSSASLALPTSTGDTTAELSGRWIRSATSPWEISPFGGNLGPYVRAAASKEASRLLYVAKDDGRSKGSYVLRLDYILADSSDTLGVKVFVSNRDITVGTAGGDFRMNSTQKPGDMVMLPSGKSWATYYLPVELGDGYNYIYVLFTGSGAGNTGLDNISLTPKVR